MAGWTMPASRLVGATVAGSTSQGARGGKNGPMAHVQAQPQVMAIAAELSVSALTARNIAANEPIGPRSR
jgi:hypothetical protein